MKPCLIFDLDGTLVDSLPGIAASLNRTLDAHGLPGHSDARVRSFIGDGIRNLILRAISADTETATFESLLAFYRKDYALSWRAGTRIYPGISYVLGELQESGFEMAVLSNKSHDFAVEMVEAMFPSVHFATVFGQREGVPHKPQPDGALQIADRFGVSPADCVMIGDSTMDLETAVNAGMRGIAVSWGYHDRDRLLAAGTADLIDAPEELLALLGE